MTQQQIDEMKQSIDTIKYLITFEPEQEVYHAVIARLYAFGKRCFNSRK
jgi:hypothetical protein